MFRTSLSQSKLLFGIVTLLFLLLFAAVMEKCAFTLRARCVTSSLSLTGVLIWLFVGITLICFERNDGAVDFRSLKLICFGLLCASLLLVISIWSCYLFLNRALILPAIKGIFFMNPPTSVYPNDTIQNAVLRRHNETRHTNLAYETGLVDEQRLERSKSPERQQRRDAYK